MIVRFTQRAENDLAGILARRGAETGRKPRRNDSGYREHPLAGRRTPRRLLSVKVVRRHPYKIFYRARDD